MVILEQQWAVLAYSLNLVWVWVWNAIAGGVEGLLTRGVTVFKVAVVRDTLLLGCAVGAVRTIRSIGVSVHVERDM